jgi:hypothetical protein
MHLLLLREMVTNSHAFVCIIAPIKVGPLAMLHTHTKKKDNTCFLGVR